MSYLFKQTQKTIDFVNQNHEMFEVIIMDWLYEKRCKFDKIVVIEMHHTVEILVYINSTKFVSTDWNLKNIVLKI